MATISTPAAALGHEVPDRVAVPPFRKQHGDLLREVRGRSVVAFGDHERRLIQSQAVDVHSGGGRAQGEDRSGGRAEQRRRPADVFDQRGDVFDLAVGGVSICVTAGTPSTPVVVDYGEVLGEKSREFGRVRAVCQCRGNQDDGRTAARLFERDLGAVCGDGTGFDYGRLLSRC
ncbi:hypothetical protein STENM327S_00319 [Streptomyces tendae]